MYIEYALKVLDTTIKNFYWPTCVHVYSDYFSHKVYKRIYYKTSYKAVGLVR